MTTIKEINQMKNINTLKNAKTRLRSYLMVSMICLSLASYTHRCWASISQPPLTLSESQASKLQQIFPNKITETDAVNAGLMDPSEHLVWQKIPLEIALPIGQERLIRFSQSVQFGYDTTILKEDMLSVQNVDGAVYLVAKKSFDAQRVFVRLKQSGELVLLNLSAKDGASHTPVDIIVPATDNNVNNTTISINQTASASSLTTSAALTTGDDESSGVRQNSPLSEIDLMRFAIQQLYAPKRLVTQPNCVVRVAMHTTRTVRLFSCDEVTAMPLISWRSGDLYVTAIELRNQRTRNIVLDPRKILGTWKATVFFPQICLKPCGNSKDTTTVFLISDQPFNETMET